MNLTDELAFVLLAIKDSGPFDPEHYGLIYKALALAEMCGYEAGVRADPEAPEWFVVFIDLPAGQVGFHVPQYPHEYDGHTTEEKYRRIEDFAQASTRKDALWKLGAISEELGLYDE